MLPERIVFLKKNRVHLCLVYNFQPDLSLALLSPRSTGILFCTAASLQRSRVCEWGGEPPEESLLSDEEEHDREL